MSWNGGYPGQNHGPGGHHGGGYGPPPGGHGGYGGYGGYGPPQGPPPQGYDQYGYPPQQYQQPPPQHYQQPPPQHYQQQGGYQQGGYQQGGYHQQQQQYQGGHDARAAHAPPQQAQSFGHGAPSDYTFQYSNCTGKRKALLIGINYIGTDNALRGCINDVHNVSSFLMERQNYRREDMVILTDDQQDPVLRPTRANILRAMAWLVQGAQPNDALFLHYSGHGGQTEDTDGDEDDGYDETIYPVDFKEAGMIIDDELHSVVVRPLQAGVRLTAIFDSCHSGSVLDLPYIYSTKGVLKEPNLAEEAGKGLLGAVMAYAQGNLAGVATSIFDFARTAVKGDGAYKKTVQTKTSPADVVMWSGSKDDQTSADATIASQATGAMSWAFITAITQNPQQSYLELLNSIRDVLESKYTQKPQLSCSHPLDVNLLFVM
ncbi:MAG: Ca(2+)-dependent cysteine protease [Sporothrix thermara]